jgi:hypothetical protein
VTVGGWLFMSLSCGTVTALTIFCYARMLRASRRGRKRR